ncbi:MAG: CHAT domain-containing tetratricopeptide repeat protein [Acidobacteriota bacterium]
MVAYELDDLVNAELFFRGAAGIRSSTSPGSLELAESLDALASVSYRIGRLTDSEHHYTEALYIREHHNVPEDVKAISWRNLGILDFHRGYPGRARQRLEKARLAMERAGRSGQDYALVLKNLGNVHFSEGSFALARVFYEKALVVQEAVPAALMSKSSTLSNLGLVEYRTGDLAEAENFVRRGLTISRALNANALAVATQLASLGDISFMRGDLRLAERYYRESAAISGQNTRDALSNIYVTTCLGIIANQRGDLFRAKSLFEKALRERRALGQSGLVVADLIDFLAIVNEKMGSLNSAGELYEEALELRETWAPGSLSVASSLVNRASWIRQVHGLDGFGNARIWLEKALQINQMRRPLSSSTATNLYALGNVMEVLGEPDSALEYWEEARFIVESTSPNVNLHSSIVYQLARDSIRRRDVNAGLDLLRQAIEIFERQFGSIGGRSQVRASFRLSYRRYYEDLIDLLVARGKTTEPFDLLERSRARVFLARMAEKDNAAFIRIPASLENERQRLRLSYQRLLRDSANGGKEDPVPGTSQSAFAELDREWGELEERIRDIAPRGAAIQLPQPFDVEGARDALDDGTLLLSYSTTNTQLTIFALSRDQDLTVEVVPTTSEELRADVDLLRSQIEEAADPNHRQQVGSTSRRLFDLLVSPVADRVADAERLLILPDGPLHALPFAALVDADGTYLIEHKPIHIALSATVYAELRKERCDGEAKGPTKIELVAFGDPHYPDALRHGPRRTGSILADMEALDELPGDAVVRSVIDRGIFSWTRLLNSRREVLRIAELFPSDQVQVFLGPDASEENLRSISNKTRILHLAAHGHTDEHLPSSSFVALSIPNDVLDDDLDPKLERDNGLLQVWEVFERLQFNGDLVVLSACESGLGKELGSEGLIGLTRAFQYAGARSVAASLWSVSDLSTSELMVRFYRHLQSGLSKDEALRAAQIELLRGPVDIVDGKGETRSRNLTAPYHWAAFQVFGDWQ